MAGHGQFKNIMHRKGAQDKKRAALFTKLAKEITIAAKSGLPDPEMNPRLRLAVANARAVNMPKDNIKRAIEKAQGGGGEGYEELRYEGFAPGGVGVIVEVSTDNRNRAASDVRATFAKNGGNLGETGAVAFLFDQLGEIDYAPEAATEEAMLEAALEAGAADVASDKDGHLVTTTRESLMEAAAALEAKLGPPRSAKIVWRPQARIAVAGETAQTVLKLLDLLDDLDDVQAVYANADFAEADLAAFAG